MDGERIDSEFGIKKTKSIDVEDHGEEDRRYECGMVGQPKEVVVYGDIGWCSARWIRMMWCTLYLNSWIYLE